MQANWFCCRQLSLSLPLSPSLPPTPRPAVTLCGWRDVKVQELSFSLIRLFFFKYITTLKLIFVLYYLCLLLRPRRGSERELAADWSALGYVHSVRSPGCHGDRGCAWFPPWWQCGMIARLGPDGVELMSQRPLDKISVWIMLIA